VAFPFPVLDSAEGGVRFKDVSKFLLDVFVYAKFASLHASNDLTVEFVIPKRLTVHKMGVGWPGAAPGYP
jgi:hypothetical protein